MAKRKHSKKQEVNSLEDAIREHGGLIPEDGGAPMPTQGGYDPGPPPANRPLPLSLADIRTEALRAHSNTAHTIADLEAWAAEIAATIAFLKERGR
jgi:hypothetical protein